ncbi:MAG: hypothetical protein M4D80_14940 [Myxococcota bacterium]|nr:hypothetical protein [Myxococcota bacterium]
MALAGRALADSTSPSGGAAPAVDCEPDCDGDGETNADDGDLDVHEPDDDDVREEPVDVGARVEDLDDEGSVGDETARSPLDAGAPFVEDSLGVASGLIDATSLHDLEARHQRPSRWGRVDLAVAWRRIDTYDEPSEPSRRHEILLVATWRN